MLQHFALSQRAQKKRIVGKSGNLHKDRTAVLLATPVAALRAMFGASSDVAWAQQSAVVGR